MKKNVLLLTVLMISVLCAKAQEPAYRPMVEKGKVWKVGWIPSGSDEANVAQAIAYYWLEDITDPVQKSYFDKDWARLHMKLMREYVCSERYKEKFPVGPQDCLYLKENGSGGCVYYGSFCKTATGKYQWINQYIYPFGPYDSYDVTLYNRQYYVRNKEVVMGSFEKGFKGRITPVVADNSWYSLGWGLETESYYSFTSQYFEGVGGQYGPIPSLIDPTIEPIEWYLMECRVGDEVLYSNPDIIDGVNPPDDETKKRIDFTHVQKPRPKAPGRTDVEGGRSFDGAFTSSMLDLSLGAMSGTCTVIITDASGETVYENSVDAADILSLNIDISRWSASTYTVTVESDGEKFVGSFSPMPTSITSLTDGSAAPADGVIYDLTGRRLDHEPSQGLYIKDGRKVLKR